jgi:hypothetical protein
MLSYRQILKQSLKITWRNKYLWFFGLFASFLIPGLEYKILMTTSSQEEMINLLTRAQVFFNFPIFQGGLGKNIVYLFSHDPGAAILTTIGFLILLLLLAFVIWLVISSQISLINNTEKIIKGRDDNYQTDLRVELKNTRHYFWPTLGLNFLTRIIVGMIIFLIILPLVFINSNPILVNIFYFISFIVLVPLAVFISLTIKYAITYVILKGLTIKQSFKAALELFNKNWLISIEISLILFVLTFVITIGALIGAMIIYIPFILLTITCLQFISAFVAEIIMFLGAVTALALIAIIGSAATTYQTVVWTNLFMNLTSYQGESKLARLLPRLTTKISIKK